MSQNTEEPPITIEELADVVGLDMAIKLDARKSSTDVLVFMELLATGATLDEAWLGMDATSGRT